MMAVNTWTFNDDEFAVCLERRAFRGNQSVIYCSVVVSSYLYFKYQRKKREFNCQHFVNVINVYEND